MESARTLCQRNGNIERSFSLSVSPLSLVLLKAIVRISFPLFAVAAVRAFLGRPSRAAAADDDDVGFPHVVVIAALGLHGAV